MGKYKGSGVDAVHHDLTQCKNCGWNFERDNATREPVGNGKTRTTPRSPIAVRSGGVVCDVCYCRALMMAGKHSAIGTPYAGLHRDALFPQAAAPPAQPQQRFNIATAIAQTAARFGEAAADFTPELEDTP